MSTRRGRPRSFDRDAALDALLFLFWERGYEATSQAAMIERAGISSSSLYNTFGNKADVFDAVLARYNAMLHDLLAPLRDGNGGLADVDAFLAGMAADLRAGEAPPGCLMVRTMTELGGRPGPPQTGARTATYRDQIAEALRAALGRSAEAGEIGAGGAEVKVTLVLAVYLGALAVAVSAAEVGAQMMDGARAMIWEWSDSDRV